MRLIYGYKSDRGIRVENQDSLMIREAPLLKSFGIADGMGGLQYGQLASNIACEAFSDELSINRYEDIDEVSQVVLAKYRQVNAFIYNLAKQKQVKMGTTFSMINIVEDSYIISNAGDTRIYILRDGSIKQLSIDHTGERLPGYSKADSAQKRYLRNALTMALGVDNEIYPYVFKGKVIKNDLFVLCSDGIYKYVDEQEIIRTFCCEEIRNNEDLFKIWQIVVDKAAKRSSKDNMSIIAVKIG